MAPWASALYACDQLWWRLRGPAPEAFKGLRFIGKDDWPGCTCCNVKAGDLRMRFDGERLGAGANSGFQAVNLAALAGASRIVLTGYDMQHTGGLTHWHGDHGGGLTNPPARMLQGSAAVLDSQAKTLADRGIEVLNATRETALKAFPRIQIGDAF